MKKYKFPEIKVKVTISEGDDVQVTNANVVVDIVRSVFNSDTLLWTEEMVMVCLNRNHKVVGYYKVASGGFSGVVCDPKVIMTIALQSAASSIVLAHNHPSGNLTPSVQDKNMTDKIKQACQLFDINLLDHIIVTDKGYYSFAENGCI
jgi:DNA repair protein RadC